MSIQFDMIPLSEHPAAHQPLRASEPGPTLVATVAAAVAEDGLWEGPTLRELVDRVEHQFGQAPALTTVFMMGFARDESLTPGDVQAVCDHLGLPPEDFGLDP